VGLDRGAALPHLYEMGITLLALSTGHYSLEFEMGDLASVKSAIREIYGRPVSDNNPFLAEIRFGGSSFTFQNEWDDPCLVSGSSEGDEILQTLHAHLNTV
jgi:hypothetical protein